MDLNGYREYLSRLPVSVNTRRSYLGRVKHYLEWLSGTPDGEKALTSPVERDFSVRDYKAWLLQSGASANSVNSVLSALDNLFIYLGLGVAKVKRQSLPGVSPRALDAEEQRRL